MAVDGPVDSSQMPEIPRPRGRPRSERSRTAVLAAAAELLFSEGYSAITMDRLAERAAVSKATIYKWWSSKGAVVVDAFLATVQPLVPAPEHGDTHEELAEPARAQMRLFRDSPVGLGLASMVAAAQ